MIIFIKGFYFTGILFFMLAVLFAPSQQRRLLAMVTVLLNFALVLVGLHFEYTAFIVVIVYVGAISVLFLFIIMLVNLVRTPLTFLRPRVVLVGLLVGVLGMGFVLVTYYTSVELVGLVESSTFSTMGLGYKLLFTPSIVFLESGIFFQPSFDLLLNNVEIEQLGWSLWTNYGLLILLCGLILVVSIIGSVVVLKGMLLANVEKRKSMVVDKILL
jgi:NADH:ubiquinone oxidoreductase subunit 6 (subunit J)